MNWLLFQGFKRKPNDLKKLAKAVKYAHTTYNQFSMNELK